MEESDLRSAVTADVAIEGGAVRHRHRRRLRECRSGARNGWLIDLTLDLEADADYDVDDLLEPVREALSVDGKLYAVPFYGESSILMYNKEMFDEAG